MFGLKAANDRPRGSGRLPADAWSTMVESMPVNVMVCDIKTFDVLYANKATIDTLRSIEHALPIKADRRDCQEFRVRGSG